MGFKKSISKESFKSLASRIYQEKTSTAWKNSSHCWIHDRSVAPTHPVS